MKRRRRRAYDSSTIMDGVQAVADLRSKVTPPELIVQRMVNPGGGGDKKAEEEQAEMLEGNCFGHPEESKVVKRQFKVEGEQEMKNGAIRKYGKCVDCGRGLSRFVSKKDAKAAA
jgi:hypothetical protein